MNAPDNHLEQAYKELRAKVLGSVFEELEAEDRESRRLDDFLFTVILYSKTLEDFLLLLSVYCDSRSGRGNENEKN